MKKRAFLIALAALLCLLCALCLAACDEEPTPTPAPVCQHHDADDNALCDKCGESYTDGIDVTPPGGNQNPGGDQTPGGNDTPTHPHVFGEWIVTTPATCVTKGIQTHACDCGHSETQYIAIDTTAHSAGTEWKTDGTHHWKSCTRTGCDARVNEAAHTPAAAWSSDATNHWYDCTACGHDMTTPVAHTYDAENTCACQHYKDAGVRFTLAGGTYIVTGYTGTATEVIIPSKYKGIAVTAIDGGAFSGCRGLQSITIPASVTAIEFFAFSECSGLQSVTFGANSQLTTIGSYAFSECSGLQTVTFGANSQLTTIGDCAFDKCSSLQSITIPAGVTTIGSDAFSECRGLTSITIPAGVTAIGECAFVGCSSLQSVTFGNPNGWWYASSFTATSGTALSATDLARTDTAADYLGGDYADYYWKRS